MGKVREDVADETYNHVDEAFNWDIVEERIDEFETMYFYGKAKSVFQYKILLQLI